MGKAGHANNQIFRITAHLYKSQRLQNIRSFSWLFTDYNSCLVLTSCIWQAIKFWKWKKNWNKARPYKIQHKNQLIVANAPNWKKAVFTNSFRSLWSMFLISYCWLTAIKSGNIVKIEWQAIHYWQISLFTVWLWLSGQEMRCHKILEN